MFPREYSKRLAESDYKLKQYSFLLPRISFLSGTQFVE